MATTQKLLFSAEALLDIPMKIAISDKKQGCRERWEEGFLFPLPVVHRALSFSPLRTTTRGLCQEERDTELKRATHRHTSEHRMASPRSPEKREKIAVLRASLSALRYKIMIMRTKSF